MSANGDVAPIRHIGHKYAAHSPELRHARVLSALDAPVVGRVFLLKFLESPQAEVYWFEDGETERTAEHARALN